MKDVSVVFAHGAWADGSSWARVITALAPEGVGVTAAPLPLTSLADDVAALDRTCWWDMPMPARSLRSPAPNA